MSNAEKRWWIEDRTQAETAVFSMAHGRPSLRSQRRAIQSRVKSAFQEKYGWLQTLLWAVAIARIVLQILDQLYGQETPD